jgi:pseudouridine synthase
MKTIRFVVSIFSLPLLSLSLSTPRIEKTVVLIYNKPANVVTTHTRDDPLGRSNVYDEILSMKGFCTSQKDRVNAALTFEQATGIESKLQSIGRLDADTSGLLLLTNDGGLVHHVTNSDAKSASECGPVAKTYQALVMGHYESSSSMLQTIQNDGVDIGAKYGGMTRPVEDLVVLGHPTAKSTLVSLTLTQGKNRQVRRMFHALGSGVIKLKRVRIGKTLTLEGLEEGEWRVLSANEVMEGLHWRPRELYPSGQAKMSDRKGGIRSTRVKRLKGI